MALSSNLYQAALDQFIQGNAQWKSAGHTVKMALLTSTYTPNLSTHVHFSDLTNEVTGTGYTAGGATLASLTNTETAANSWATAWATSQTWTAGQVIRPSTGNGRLYVCIVGGAGSTTTEPTWPTTVGATVTDNAATWSCLGESITVYSSGNGSWTTSTITARYAVIYDAQTGTGTTEPLICLVDFGTNQSSTAGTFTVSPDSALGWFYTSPA